MALIEIKGVQLKKKKKKRKRDLYEIFHTFSPLCCHKQQIIKNFTLKGKSLKSSINIAIMHDRQTWKQKCCRNCQPKLYQGRNDVYDIKVLIQTLTIIIFGTCFFQHFNNDEVKRKKTSILRETDILTRLSLKYFEL